MKTLEQIKNDYAVTQSFQNWIHLMQYHILIDSQHVLDAHFNNVMTITQKECLKLASEDLEWHEMQKITNENNIIK